MTYPKPIVRCMEDVVTAMSAKVLPIIQAAELLQLQVSQPEATESSVQIINYQFGHLKELIATMKEWESAPDYRCKKYPLVALLLDFPEQMGSSGGYIGEVTLQMILAMYTEKGLKAADRYAKNFEPILLPIYHELLKQIEASPYFVTLGVSRIKHTKTDHPYWGHGGLSDTQGNVFADCVDAIEIANLQLKINFSQFQTILVKQ